MFEIDDNEFKNLLDLLPRCEEEKYKVDILIEIHSIAEEICKKAGIETTYAFQPLKSSMEGTYSEVTAVMSNFEKLMFVYHVYSISSYFMKEREKINNE